MDWIILIIAGLLEAVWTSSLKYTNGFTRPLPSIVTIVALVLSFLLLAQSVKTLPVGIAYTVWTGIGVVGTVTVGAVFLGESRDLPRLICIGLIVVGIIGLRLIDSK